MSKYQLTEAYGELYNQRLTEASFYDNLRFVDYLQQEEIEEVMESLIWEFMDYGDTLDEAVDTLEVTFSDDEVLIESLELISEAMSVSQRRASQRAMRGNYKAQETQRFKTSAKASASKATRDLEYASELAKRSLSSASDSAARARRAFRSVAIRNALNGAMRSVKGAMETTNKQIRDKKTQLKKTGTEVAGKAQAALARVGRGGRRIVNAVKGAYQGAKSGAKAGFNAPLAAPKPRMSKGQYNANKEQRAKDAQTSQSGAFSAPKATLPVLTQKPPLPPHPRAAVAAQALRTAASTATAKSATKPESTQGRVNWENLRGPRTTTSGHSQLATRQRPTGGSLVSTRVSPVNVRDVTKSRSSLPPSGESSGSTKKGKLLTAPQRQMKNAVKRFRDSVDYDLLTQYMIEDLIHEGYAESELQAVSILEDMTEQNLNEFANLYLQD